MVRKKQRPAALPEAGGFLVNIFQVVLYKYVFGGPKALPANTELQRTGR
jgi:hypothetical protein